MPITRPFKILQNHCRRRCLERRRALAQPRRPTDTRRSSQHRSRHRPLFFRTRLRTKHGLLCRRGDWRCRTS